MKRRVKRTIVSFEATPRDRDNISHGSLKRGGISTTKLLRDLLEADRGTRVLSLIPSMVPPADFKDYIKGMQALEGTIEYVAESGLPSNYGGASDEECDTILNARNLFIQQLDFIATEVKKFVLFGRLVAALEGCNVEALMAFVGRVEGTRNRHERETQDPATTQQRRIVLAKLIAELNVALQWFRSCGLLPPTVGKSGPVKTVSSRI